MAAGQRMHRRLQRVQEYMLDDESLISNLTDEEAKVLIGWGLGQAREWVAASAGLPNPDARSFLIESMGRVREAIRGINHFVGDREKLGAPAAEFRLRELFLQTGAATGGQVGQEAIQAACHAVAAEMGSLNNVDLIQRLVEVANQALPKPPAVSAESLRPTHRRIPWVLLVVIGLAVIAIVLIVLAMR